MFDTLVITTVSRWDEPPRIRHQITMEMQKYFKQILFLETPTRTTSSEIRHKHQLRQVASNVYAYRMPNWYSLPRSSHALLPVISKFHQDNILKTIVALLKKMEYREVFLFNFNFADFRIHNDKIFSFSSFILNDNFIDRVKYKTIRSYVENLQSRTASRADLCFAVSTPLLQQILKFNSNSKLLLPGHSFDCSFKKNGSLYMYSKEKNEKIRVCFMGYINKRLDLSWIEHAAKHSAIDFFLLGPNELSSNDISKLESCGVIFLPPKTGQDLKEFLASCHVLTIPYNIEKKSVQAIEASNKLFQYIASGRPIVASSMPNLLELPESVLTKAHSKQDFLEKIIHVAESDCLEFQKIRLRIAFENTWEKRGIEVIHYIEQALVNKTKHIKK